MWRLVYLQETYFSRLDPLHSLISETATHLIERHAKSHNLQIPDALIAATALETRSELLTLNVRDFRFIAGLSLK